MKRRLEANYWVEHIKSYAATYAGTDYKKALELFKANNEHRPGEWKLVTSYILNEV